MKSVWLFAVIIVLLAGCSGSPTPSASQPFPGNFLVEAKNNATAPAWFQLKLDANGNTVDFAQKRALGGETVTWIERMQRATSYKFTLAYSLTPDLASGFTISGEFASDDCKGEDYFVQASGDALNGEPSMSFGSRNGCPPYLMG